MIHNTLKITYKLLIVLFLYLFINPTWGTHIHHEINSDEITIKTNLNLCKYAKKYNGNNQCKWETYVKHILENGTIYYKNFNVRSFNQIKIKKYQFLYTLHSLTLTNLKEKFLLKSNNTAKDLFLLSLKSKRSPPKS